MKDSLAPTLVQPIGSFRLLWFEKSNQYIIIAESLYTLIKAFLASENDIQFMEVGINLEYDDGSLRKMIEEIGQFLEDCNVQYEEEVVAAISFSNTHRILSHCYQMDDKAIQIHYSSEELRGLIHPQLEYLEIPGGKNSTLCVFDIYTAENHLALFKDETLLGFWKKTDYHLLQGKLAMHILCALHSNDELDWMGTFHASTVVKKDQAIMVIGDSGKGKSTFTALLLGNGYEILADDISPILATDSLVYPNPGGISIKAGSFDILKSSLAGFDELPQHYINPYKGYVKYVGTPKSKGYLKGYPCKNIVRINYIKDSQTKLETISIAQALNTLIPESWLAHKKIARSSF